MTLLCEQCEKNEARYLAVRRVVHGVVASARTCGICDAIDLPGFISVRLSDLPQLLAIVGDIALEGRLTSKPGDDYVSVTPAHFEKLRELIQKRGATFK